MGQQQPKITFDAKCGLDDDERDHVKDALLGVARSDDKKVSEEQCRLAGLWPADVTSVLVHGRLSGGRGGAQVLQVSVTRVNRPASLQVAKLMSYSEADREWKAYKSLRETFDSHLYVAITAVSRAVLEERGTEAPFSTVVYRHVSAWDHAAGELSSLEDVVTETVDGTRKVAHCSQTLSTVMTSLRQNLYTPASEQQDDLGSGNGRLGVDIQVRVDKIVASGGSVCLVDGNPAPDDVFHRPSSSEVLRSATSPPGPRRSLHPDDRVAFTLENVSVEGTTVLGDFRSTRIRVVLVGAAKQQVGKVRAGRSVEVQGRVTMVRALQWSSLLRDHFEGADAVDEGEETLRWQGVTVAHPLAGLLEVLDADPTLRLRSAVHGDLNPRNVILSGDTPFLIDFATFNTEDFTLTDTSWLEVCILRDCMAERLSWEQTVRLQRALGALTLLLPHWAPTQLAQAAESLAEALGGHDSVLGRCLSIMWQVRAGIWTVVPESCRDGWPRQYFEHLLLAACRTFKWSVPEAPERVRVSAAVAGVASEFLSCPTGPSRWWDHDVDALVRVLLAAESEDAFTQQLLEEAVPRAKDPHLRTAVLKRLSEGPLREARSVLYQRYGQADDGDWRGDDRYISLEGRELAPGRPYLQQGQGALTSQARDCLELLREPAAVVLLAEPGGGKTRIARELGKRGTAEPDAQSSPELLPLRATALQIMEFLLPREGSERTLASFLLQLADVGPTLSTQQLGYLIDLGSVHLTVDDLHLVSVRDQRKILTWIKRLHNQQRSLRLLVCQRVGDFHPETLRWPAVVVHKIRENAARTYASEVLRDSGKHWQHKLSELESRLFADPQAAALRDLAGRPQFLRLLVDHFATTGRVPAHHGELVRKHLDGLLDAKGTDGLAPEQLLRLLGRLAEQLGSAGSLDRTEALAVLKQAAPETPAEKQPPADLLTTLLSTGVVIESVDRISFRSPPVQSYCAAVALQQYGIDQLDRVTELILRHGWREPAVLLVADEHTHPRTVLEVVSAGVRASPWYGALLLQAAPQQCTQAVHERFLRRQGEVLRSAYSGVPAWKGSAYALAKYGVPDAVHMLVKVARSAHSAAEAALAALDGLVMMHQWSVPGATQRLSEVIRELLDARLLPTGVIGDTRVVVHALRSVEVAHLEDLAGYAWSRVDDGQPWEIVVQAWNTLRQLGVAVDRARSRVYADACHAQLAYLDRSLLATADTDTAELLNQQRLEVLHDLAAAGEVETLLRYRFRTGLAAYPNWGLMLQEAVTARRACGGTASAEMAALLDDRLLETVGLGSEQWKRLLTLEDEGVTAMAAHFILAANDVVSLELLGTVAAQGTAHSLSVVAAFVHCLPPEEHKELEQLLDPFLPGMDTEMVEAVAGFVAAAETLHQETGRRLAVRVQHALAGQNLAQEALHWPWCTTWRRALPPRAEIQDFVREHDGLAPERQQGPDPTLLSLLGSADVLLDAPYVKPVPLAPPLRTRLRDLKPSTPDGVGAHQFVLMAASAGLPEELTFVKQVATDSYNVQTIIRHAHGRHGLVEVTLAAHAVTAVGYLGMLAAREDPDLDDTTITDPLEALGRDTGDMHPSMERARLIALGYWGQLAPLLGALCAREDPILADAVRNIVTYWLPGPRTSTSKDTYFTTVAHTLSDELNSKQLPPQTRALLTELRIGIEDRLGRYVI
ncbi:hypothetical protein ACGF3J_38415 [Streptomyces sp. NPDC048171]|uniref:hypothetical protein n=1 Tax=Streptomyces sp. NPDC048171 TaxID=3365504 RepID=UPI00371976A3